MSFKAEVVEKIAALMTAAFGLIAALAWNEAIKDAINKITFLTQYGIYAYAILVTILAVVMTIWIARVATKMNK